MPAKSPSKQPPSGGNPAPVGNPAPSGNPVTRFFSLLGPGLITGAADDDPSGIATCTLAGAQLGTTLLWTALFTWPLMAAVQMMCARIGIVTGQGLAAALRAKFPKWALILVCVALLIANVINIGADLSGMGEVAAMLSGLNSKIWILLFGAGITFATVRFRYQQIASILKWLAAILLAYVVEAFIIHPNWHAVLRDTFIPTWPKNHDTWTTLVAIFGTTISPYLFFWQSSQEVEEEKASGRRLLIERRQVWPNEITNRRIDVVFGTFFSNIVIFFVILASAFTLHTAGKMDVQTSRQAAEALQPIAGRFAALLYTLGILGAGLLTIPTLGGSAAYAFAETFHWRQGLDRGIHSAAAFYGILIFSTIAGIIFNFFNINPVKALFWTAVINGLLAPPLLIGILLVASNKKIMCGKPSSHLSLLVVGIATLVMFAAAIGMFL